MMKVITLSLQNKLFKFLTVWANSVLNSLIHFMEFLQETALMGRCPRSINCQLDIVYFIQCIEPFVQVVSIHSYNDIIPKHRLLNVCAVGVASVLAKNCM
jgi:hypothetical protein